MVVFKELSLPSQIVSLVKKMVKNPVKAGITIFLIYQILKPYLNKNKEFFEEKLSIKQKDIIKFLKKEGFEAEIKESEVGSFSEDLYYHGVNDDSLKKIKNSGYIKKGTYVSKSRAVASKYSKMKGGDGKYLILDLKNDEVKPSGHSNQFILTKDYKFSKMKLMKKEDYTSNLLDNKGIKVINYLEKINSLYEKIIGE